MTVIEEIPLNERIENRFQDVLIKKEAGNLYITKSNLIWISSEISKELLGSTGSVKDCYSNYIETNPNCDLEGSNSLCLVESWENLYANRKRGDKRLVGLRFEKKKQNINNCEIEYVDVNLVLKNDSDFNQFTELIVSYHNEALERARRKKEAETLSNEHRGAAQNNSSVGNKILTRRKIKALKKKTLYEEINQLLRYKPELEQIYKNLVLTGNISLESFINLHRQDIAFSTHQEKGIDNSDYFLKKPPKYSVINDGNIDVTITAEDLRLILEEMPLIKSKMSEYVPHRLTEEEFWNRIIHSPLFFSFLGIKNKSESNNDTLSMGDIPKGEQLLCELSSSTNAESASENRLDTYVDLDVNLSTNDKYNSGKKGYGTLINNDLNISSDNSNNVNAGFFERFNFHGAKILDLTTGSNYRISRESDRKIQHDEHSQDNLHSPSLFQNNVHSFDVKPEDFFSKSKLCKESDVEQRKRNRDKSKVELGIKDVNVLEIRREKCWTEDIFSDEISKKILVMSTKQVQSEQISQLSYANKSSVMESKIENKLFLFDSIDQDRPNGENNDEDRPAWLTQVQNEHMQVVELLRIFWGLSLSQKDNENRKRTIEALNKIASNIELLVHDNTNLSASKISAYGHSTNKIKTVCLSILDSIKSARNFHYKLEELIKYLNNNK